jgi:phosphoglycolate phosphatase
MTPTANVLIFDLDGTISDPALGIGRSINHALVAHGFASIEAAEVSRCIGPPLDESFARLVPGADAALVTRLVAAYRERYADVGYAENQLYPDMPPVLHQLRERGVTLGVCTTKRVDFAEQILTLFGLREHFAFVSGGDIGVRKADQLRSLRAAGALGAAATMIGDRDIDILAAHANGLRAVGVLWGHGSADELRAARPHLLLGAPAELLQLAD